MFIIIIYVYILTSTNLFFVNLAMNNQDTLREIQRGHRLEKPNYTGQDTTQQKLDGIYGVSFSQKLN